MNQDISEEVQKDKNENDDPLGGYNDQMREPMSFAPCEEHQ